MANSMILGNLEILAESLTFAEKSGIGSERVLDLVRGMNGFLLVVFSLISHRDFTQISSLPRLLSPTPTKWLMRNSMRPMGSLSMVELRMQRMFPIITVLLNSTADVYL
jgi:hypothetical protein